MSFWQRLREWLLGLLGFTGQEYRGAGRDVVLSVLMALATLILTIYPTEPNPSERLRHAAVISVVVLIVGLILARRKLNVLRAVAAIVGFRALVAAALGLWQGLLIAAAALIVLIFCVRNSGLEIIINS
jgi:hypothetical protein